MSTFQIYGTPTCSNCTQAKILCEKEGFQYEYFDFTQLDQAEKDALELMACTQFRTVPQIFENTEHGITYVGGFRELRERLS